MGALLGRMVLVFCCDESFDFQAMGRIFAGLCQVGAWGCFDEFNRLEERILSAVSQQILTIQSGLRETRKTITLLEKNVRLDPRVGLFITMNPGYAGRSGNNKGNTDNLSGATKKEKKTKNVVAHLSPFCFCLPSFFFLSSRAS